MNRSVQSARTILNNESITDNDDDDDDDDDDEEEEDATEIYGDDVQSATNIGDVYNDSMNLNNNNE